MNVTAPLSVPDVPELILSQDASVVAVHPHPSGVTTETDPLNSLALNRRALELTAYVQGVPACVTVKAWPATVRTPARADDEGLAVTAYVTVWEPAALGPLVITIQVESLVTVQEQLAEDAVSITARF